MARKLACNGPFQVAPHHLDLVADFNDNTTSCVGSRPDKPIPPENMTPLHPRIDSPLLAKFLQNFARLRLAGSSRGVVYIKTATSRTVLGYFYNNSLAEPQFGPKVFVVGFVTPDITMLARNLIISNSLLSGNLLLVTSYLVLLIMR